MAYDSWKPAQQPLREALCTLGNGYFASRGAAEEGGAGGSHYPGTYLASGYNRLESEIAGRIIENEDLVNWPNWLCLSFRAGADHKKYGDIQRLDRILEAEGDTPNRYKASKQADVLMLFYLFSSEELHDLFRHLAYPFDPEMIPRNINYYLARTSHGSTLSQVVHSWVLARSDREQAWQLFGRALASDVADIQGGTTPEGIHLGARAGTVDVIQRCHTGIEMREDVLWLNPCLPSELKEIQLRIRYHGHWLRLHVTHTQLAVSFEHGWSGPAKIGFRDQVYTFCEGEHREFKLSAC